MNGTLLTAVEARERTGLSRYLLNKATDDGLLHPVQIGSRLFYREAEINSLLATPTRDERDAERWRLNQAEGLIQAVGLSAINGSSQ